MPEITFSVSDKLYRQMKKHPEIKWTALYRQITKEQLKKLENPDSVPIKELRDRLEKKGLSLKDLSLNKAIESYKKIKDMKWERFYSTQMD